MKRLSALASGKTWLKIALDAAAVALSYSVALSVRFEFKVPSLYLRYFLEVLPALVILFVLTNNLMRMYTGRWKYASFDELINLSSSAVLSTAIVFLAVLVIPGARKYVPVSVAVIGGVLALFTMAFVRLQFRLFSDWRLSKADAGHTNVLLVGAGEAGDMVVRDMLRHPEYDLHPVGFIDDDPFKHNLMLHGVPVLGRTVDIPSVARKHEVAEIFLTIPSATGKKIREILPYCEQTGAKIKVLPSLYMAMAGEVGVAAVRELRLEDLLGREPVETDLASISAYVQDKVVLITGAGGSIGSELARQICGVGPRGLILLDNDETSLYDMELEMANHTWACPGQVVVADIRDADRLSSVFKRFGPQVVFHSAALKHVPMMELNPSEAVKNNILGTRNVAVQAIEHGVERFILISTDKAVQPASVMGATKRASELLMKSLDARNGTLFSAVRFGNVLGSRGSVVPVFQKQIEDGGPLLVTHPDIERYFMTIEEAAQLVIQAGAFTEGGDVFILDMGEPIRIIDLAEQMVRLLGNGKDIEIRITGLRPGEKLHETLVFKVEEMLPTPHPKINRVAHDYQLPQDFDEQVGALIEAATGDDGDEIRGLLAELLPSYQPGSHEAESINVQREDAKPLLELVTENRIS
jgi:FlaA1/EpsC-like NDP-sugar epimerase